MKKRISMIVLVLCLVLMVVGCASKAPTVSVNSEGELKTSQIIVAGESTITVEPDIAWITVGVETYAKEAEAAQQANAENMNQLLSELSKAGIEEKDIQTIDYNIWPDYNYGSNDQPTIMGYRVSNNVKVTVREVESVGTLLGSLSEVGMNRSYGIQFGIADEASVYQDALAQAVKNAEKKATIVADSANVAITGLLQVVESGVNNHYEPYLEMAKAEARSYDVGISGGTLNMTARVEAIYGVK